MGNRYNVTTMGSMGMVVPFPSYDDEENGMLNPQFTMAGLRGVDDGPGASEGGSSDTFEGNSVGVATADQLPQNNFDTSTVLPGGIFDALSAEAQREYLSAAQHAANLLGGRGFTGVPNPPASKKPAGGGASGGGSGGGGLVPGGGAGDVGIFGDLFGEYTDTVVIATAILAVGGLGWLLLKHKPAASPARKRAR